MRKYLLILLLFACEEIPSIGDTKSPNVAITNPVNGEVVGGDVLVNCVATDNEGVEKVELWIDGGNTGISDSLEAYSMNWETESYADGYHTITARAYDTSENLKDSEPVSIIVAHPDSTITEIIQDTTIIIQDTTIVDGDTTITEVEIDSTIITIDTTIITEWDETFPSVLITYPPPWEQLDSTTIVKADAIDDNGVDNVIFVINGGEVFTDSLPPYEYEWDICAENNPSTYWGNASTVVAKAEDIYGNSSQSNLVTYYLEAEYDCLGTCGGLLAYDCDSTCGGNAVLDCDSTCGGTAVLQDYWCDVDGDSLGCWHDDWFHGCGNTLPTANCEGSWVTNNTDEFCNCAANFIDCYGTCGGTAYTDSCSVCVGGLTNETECTFTDINMLKNNKLVYTKNNEGMYVNNAFGSEYQQISNDAVTDFFITGDKVIFSSSTEFGQTEIYSLNLNGTDRTRLTFTTSSEELIGLTANKQKIVYNGYEPTLYYYGYYTMNLDGTGREYIGFDGVSNTTYYDVEVYSANTSGLMYSQLCSGMDWYNTCSCLDSEVKVSHNVSLFQMSHNGETITYIDKLHYSGQYYILGLGYNNSYNNYHDYYIESQNESCFYENISSPTDDIPTVSIMNSDSTNINYLTSNLFDNVYKLQFSPNDDKIFFIGRLASGGTGLYSINTDGTSQTLLTENINDSYPLNISSDGGQIIYRRSDDIYLINTDGTGETNITISSFNEEKPRFSSNGELIGFLSDRDNSNGIFFINNSGTTIDISSWFKLEDVSNVRDFKFIPNE